MTAETDLYGRAYYESHCGELYERTPHWLNFFGKIADRLVSDLRPRTALDAGCAMGFLVESLRDRGVEAEGMDISKYAISKAREDIRPHLRAGSLLDSLDGRWDLITCIEVLEHLSAADVDVAIANLCAHTDDILLSTTPRDFREATHVNVRPPEYWIGHFLRHGFVRDVEYEATYLTPWAVRLRRNHGGLEPTVVAYERALWRLLEEKDARDRLVVEQSASLASQAETHSQLRKERDWLAVEAGRLGLDLRDADAQLRNVLHRLHAAETINEDLHRALNSVAFRISRRVQRAVRRIAPANTPHGDALTSSIRELINIRHGGATHVAGSLMPRLSSWRPRSRSSHLSDGATVVPGPLKEADERWNLFVASHEPDELELKRMKATSRGWTDRPLVSILMPTYAPERWFLRAAIESVRAQAYDNWELCVVDDASPTAEAVDTVAEFAADRRIRFSRRETNGGIAAASGDAARLSTGDVIGFLDHDDELSPNALFEMVRHLLAHPEHELVYSDEDKRDVHGRRVDAHLKPDWSPELLEGCNYLCHFTVLRRDLFDRIGGFREGFDGSQDYDLFLRATEQARAIGHVGEVLYHWRMIPRSAASTLAAKPEAYEAGKRALERAIERRQENAWVEDGPRGFYYLRRRILASPTVAVVIPTRDRVDLLSRAVACVEQESGPRDVRVVIVDNDSVEPGTHSFLANTKHSVVAAPGAFNFSRLVNRGVEACGDADHVLLFNNDIVSGARGWLDALLEHSQREGIGAVGARLLRPDGRVQHEGDRVGGQGVPADNLDLTGYFGMGLRTRTVSAVTAACLMVKRTAWEDVEGFDESLRIVYNDVDFCLRLRAAGYRNVYAPLAEMVHATSASRGGHTPTEDTRIFLERWDPIHQGFDPYVGKHIWSFQPVDYR